jgi:hypothetical protein
VSRQSRLPVSPFGKLVRDAQLNSGMNETQFQSTFGLSRHTWRSVVYGLHQATPQVVRVFANAAGVSYTEAVAANEHLDPAVADNLEHVQTRDLLRLLNAAPAPLGLPEVAAGLKTAESAVDDHLRRLTASGDVECRRAGTGEPAYTLTEQGRQAARR